MRDRPSEPALLLAFRFVDVRRTERLVGRKFVRDLLRQAVAAFRVVGGFLRESDVVVHEPGSGDFLVLLGPGRDPDATLLPPKRLRGIARRIEAILSLSTELEVRSGWTYTTAIDTQADLLEQAEQAFARGSSEPERIDFFAAIGHELRTPLSTIASYLDYLMRPRTQGAIVDERKALEILHHETTRLIRLVEAMVDLSMLDFPNPTLVGGGASLPLVIQAAVDATRVLAYDRGVQVEQSAIPCASIGMSPMIAEQIFINLLENAVKHGKAGGRIDVAVSQEAGMVAVAVSDDGPGIPPGDRIRVFERGIRAATEARGRGLGLTFVRSAAESAGGDVAIDDSPLGGARLSVRLPVLH